jgi:hypothetical protein
MPTYRYILKNLGLEDFFVLSPLNQSIELGVSSHVATKINLPR